MKGQELFKKENEARIWLAERVQRTLPASVRRMFNEINSQQRQRRRGAGADEQ